MHPVVVVAAVVAGRRVLMPRDDLEESLGQPWLECVGRFAGQGVLDPGVPFRWSGPCSRMAGAGVPRLGSSGTWSAR
jgi:hypothetical protein